MIRKTSFVFVVAVLIAFFYFATSKNDRSLNFTGWEQVHGNFLSNKYSSLTEIDTTNVNQLKIAWVFHTRDADTAAHSQIQCNPIIVNGTMYVTSPRLKLFAIDAATGQQKWVFTPRIYINGARKIHFNLNNNRGVGYWTNGWNEERLFYAVGTFLFSINAKTGKVDTAFGNKGKIDLHEGLEMERVQTLYVTATSAPTIYKNILIVGTRVSEGMDAAPGDVRAFDTRTGKLLWSFHTIPHPSEPGYETWQNPEAYKYTGGGNNWMGITVDHASGVAFIPTGSAATDFYGGKRKGANLYANCLLAIDATTGKRKWHFQFVHHDTWDYDPSSAPVLLTVNHRGKKIDAVAQTTKTGFVYLFNRENGKPLFPVVETPVDTATDLADEKLWATQPLPVKPAPFARQAFTEKDINPYLSKEEFNEVKQQLQNLHSGRIFTPQSKAGTIILPGFEGGAEWGGPAVDPESNILYVNSNEMAWILKMIEIKPAENNEILGPAGVRLYKQNCMSCHGANRQGGGNFPSIADAGKKYDERKFIDFINTGRRMMPSFKHLSQQKKEAIAAYILNLKAKQKRRYIEQKPTGIDSFRVLPYQISGYDKFLTKSGLPALSPPWGLLTAINLNTGEHVWKTVLGEDPVFKAKGVAETGTENYGGPVVTKGGLLFIGATKDGKFRAFNKRTGKLLWETVLPASNFATPASYQINGKQFIVLACGGGKLGTQSGDSYVAFALPG